MKKSSQAPSFERMLYQICQKEGIDLQFLSQNWVKRLKKNGKIHYVVGYKFDLNSQATGLIMDDKFATFETLSFAEVPVIQHRILYEPGNSSKHALGYNSLAYIAGCFQKWNQQIVIKANNGTCGRQVFKVTDLNQLVTVLPEIFKQSYSASICPFYEIRNEYRTILLDGEEKLSYMKVKPVEKRFNLSRGAQAVEIPDEKRDQVLRLAKRAAEVLNLRFGSVDIIETIDGKMMVLEVNSGVMTQHFLEQHPEQYKKIEAMYREAIEKMFAEN